MTRKLCLLVLDGAGYSTDSRGNTVTKTTLPRLFQDMERHGFAILGASAEAVGLEAGQVGNPEAGHLTIGAGRKVPGMTRRILEAYQSGAWARDDGWGIPRQAGVLHVLGLLSDAGIHGLVRTVIHAVRSACDAGVGEIVVHSILDGVDSLAGTAPSLLAGVRAEIESLPGAQLGVVIGRKWFCDRGGDLDLTAVAVSAFRGKSPLPTFSDDALAAHLDGSPSEMNFPAHLVAGGRTLEEGEPVLITSHRADRTRQIAQALKRTQRLLMMVDPGTGVETDHVFFPQEPLDCGLVHEIKQARLTSVRVAERCKFPHVTFFLNGFNAGLEGDGICIPSIPEATIGDQPEMSAREVTAAIVDKLQDPEQRIVIANLANLDQVGHLGRVDLSIRAAEEIDEAYTRIANACRRAGWTLIVTSDHGNADRVTDEEGRPFGSHTHRPVPFFALPPPGSTVTWMDREGTLANVAATCLGVLELDPPAWMEQPLFRLEPDPSGRVC